MTNLSNNVKFLLLRKEKRPAWLSANSKVTSASVSRLLAGQGNPTLDTVEELAKALDVDPWLLIEPPELFVRTAEERKKKADHAEMREKIAAQKADVGTVSKDILEAYESGAKEAIEGVTQSALEALSTAIDIEVKRLANASVQPREPEVMPTEPYLSKLKASADKWQQLVNVFSEEGAQILLSVHLPTKAASLLEMLDEDFVHPVHSKHALSTQTESHTEVLKKVAPKK